MGLVKKVLVNREVPTPKFNGRLTIELCENVHLHYRNLRLEFSKEEFIELIQHLADLDLSLVDDFDYGPNEFLLLREAKLQKETEFDKRLQIEEQADGTFHVHYRNLRIEVNNLEEIGCDQNSPHKT